MKLSTVSRQEDQLKKTRSGAVAEFLVQILNFVGTVLPPVNIF